MVKIGLLVQVPQRKYNNYPGSTASNIYVVVDEPCDFWQATWSEKKAMHGDVYFIPMGGPGLQSGELEAKVEPRTKESVEPAFYHSLPEGFYLELLMVIPIAAVFDMTPGEGCLARAAYQLSILYTGMPFNEAHEAGLRKRLEGPASATCSRKATGFTTPPSTRR